MNSTDPTPSPAETDKTNSEINPPASAPESANHQKSTLKWIVADAELPEKTPEATLEKTPEVIAAATTEASPEKKEGVTPRVEPLERAVTPTALLHDGSSMPTPILPFEEAGVPIALFFPNPAIDPEGSASDPHPSAENPCTPPLSKTPQVESVHAEIMAASGAVDAALQTLESGPTEAEVELLDSEERSLLPAGSDDTDFERLGPTPPPIPLTASSSSAAARVTPPPVQVTPPPVNVTPPPVSVTPPPMSTTPPPVNLASIASDAQDSGGQVPTLGPLSGFNLPEALSRRTMQKGTRPWFEEVFDDDYLRTLPFTTPEQTNLEVDFLAAAFSRVKGGEILDVACGFGRHAIPLAQRGFQVTGIDLSLPLLIRAADEAQRINLPVHFVHADIREMSLQNQFDGAYSSLTSFGYFDEETNLNLAKAIFQGLRPGGRFVLDVLNRDYVVSDLPSRVWWEGDGCVVLEEVDFNFQTSRVLIHRSIAFGEGRQVEQDISLRIYCLHELGKLLRQAGFRVLEVSGSQTTPGKFFGASSRQIIAVCERPMP